VRVVRTLPRYFVRVFAGRFAVALAISLPLVVGGVVAVNVVIERRIDSIPRVKVKTAENTDPGEPANFLLIGSDTRALVQTPEEREAFGDAAAQGGQRSDTLMVIHVDPEAKAGFVVSFPRDLVVEVPDLGQSKVNAAFNTGDPNTAPQRVVNTLAQNFDIPIHHYIEVDFQSFKGIVDAMGGVPVYFAAPARDLNSGFELVPFNFKPGCYTLDGANALNYVRSRYYQEYSEGEWREDPRSDFGRIDRQQRFMRRLAVEAFRRSVNSVRTALDIADETIPKLKVDEDLNRDDINKLITSFRRVDPNDENSLEMRTFPTVEATSSSLGSIQEVKQPEADALLARLRHFGPAPDQQQGPKPSEIRVRVFNASGQSGAAAKTGSELQRQGFATVGVGNKPSVRATEVRYRPGSLNKARVVQSYLGGVGRLVEDSSTVEADVAIVLGKDFKAVAAPAGASPEPTAASAPAPTSAPVTSTGPGGKSSGPPADPTQC
jgi:polyisoprenyl-teichoic acid--peptidoglycan teichoic acid transferase